MQLWNESSGKKSWLNMLKVNDEVLKEGKKIISREKIEIVIFWLMNGVWRKHFENLRNICSNEEMAVWLCEKKVVFVEKVINIVRKLRNAKSAGIDEITVEMNKKIDKSVID